MKTLGEMEKGFRRGNGKRVRGKVGVEDVDNYLPCCVMN